MPWRLIYNSRNYMSLIDIKGFCISYKIYNSRNYMSLIDLALVAVLSLIYNSRNYMSLIDGLSVPSYAGSTIVEII